MTIKAAVDGSSLGNPGPAGWAWYVSPQVWDAGGWASGTNNMGELTAVLELLRATEAAGLAEEPLLILADSQYAINCITKWMPGWKKRGWRKADGKPVANQDILEALDEAAQGRVFRFEWVRGHNGHDMNEAADERARAVSEAYQAGRPVAGGPGFNNFRGGGPAGLEEPGDGRRPPLVRSVEAKLGDDVSEELTPTDQNREQVMATKSIEPDPIVSIAATDVGPKWPQVLDAAAKEPVTITRYGKPSLLLLDADLARQALSLLKGGS